ncbi:DinB family protein [Chitinophaga rhizophila]|uniref:DinB family protein n=1 Tax=Chitinophaga rhizophila TaxID=2866212 RepID=A0ABS7GAW0_9BACT|nr:DinB family protein [Chitinophaga rhizophila]MBW8684803.1 DinB family protein [Chitinophaga rhizophila]
MQAILTPFLDILREVYIGTQGEHSWVIDPKPGQGFTAATAAIDARQASTPIIEGGSTIAAHTEHLRWSIYFALEFFAGRKPTGNWEESWRIRQVDDQQWQQLQQDLRAAYDKLRTTIEGVNDWSEPMLVQGTLALLPHAAYHLGAVKQLLTYVQR